MGSEMQKWQFWVDRGGTFTDIVARQPNGRLVSKKLLSVDPKRYDDAVLAGILQCLASHDGDAKLDRVAVLKMGTTVATNALLERKGAKVALFVTQGFKDLLFIGDQTRPDLFAMHVKRPDPVYQKVYEIDERLDASGAVSRKIDEGKAKKALKSALDEGMDSCAIALMHAYLNPAHEALLAQWAREIGFKQVSISSQLVPLIKLVPRGQTCAVDAYLSPVLSNYKNMISKGIAQTPLMFMQSNGGLTHAEQFTGKDAILSGPAGGMVGAVKTAAQNDIEKIISFDMGGTSTDVGLYAGQYLRNFEPDIEGFKLQVPCLDIHTVAAGGGSLISFKQGRMQVGPDSAGSFPGPLAYGKGGPLTITDCNVHLGRLQAEFFPKVFGADGAQALDEKAVAQKFNLLAAHMNSDLGVEKTSYELADRFLDIACQNMANAIRKISTGRGYDLNQFTLSSFGGAGGQHACRVADHLGLKRIFIHPLAGVLSALGIGLADLNYISQKSIGKHLDAQLLESIHPMFTGLEASHQTEIEKSPAPPDEVFHHRLLYVRYTGSDTKIEVNFDHDLKAVAKQFKDKHQQYFGFTLKTDVVLESISLQSQGVYGQSIQNPLSEDATACEDAISIEAYFGGKLKKVRAFNESNLPKEMKIDGPSLIFAEHGTIVVEEHWAARKNSNGCLILSKLEGASEASIVSNYTKPDPFYLEIFNNLFMSIAENMGAVLKNTASSVNIKEREDYSCALFNQDGLLVSNAPHMPVHLGSMSESVKSLIAQKSIEPGQVFIHNSPYSGGTHLPDMTVISPIFIKGHKHPVFYVASRGHHADCGGISPGSMPSQSIHISQEGVLLDHELIVDKGVFCEDRLTKIFEESQYAPRNIEQNICDIKAQIVANKRGESELLSAIDEHGLEMVCAYMQHIQDNAEKLVREVISKIEDSQFTVRMDQGVTIGVKLSVDKSRHSMLIDFSDSSKAGDHNFNAPAAVCKAAVLYVLRSVLEENIPLNDGCLKPVTIKLAEDSVLNPSFPRAVVAGNVETSQAIVNALWGALGSLAGSAGTMNNLSFGNQNYQYYETIGGGSGAGDGFDGADSIQTHMTNSKMTDPEVMESRFPVVLKEFSIRKGSGGKGKWRGGQGAVRKLEFQEPMQVNIISNNRLNRPFGLKGGTPGLPGANYLLLQGLEKQNLASTQSVEVKPGDVLVIETPGGGGYGAC